MKPVKLKNGSTELEAVVTATMISLKHLAQANIPTSFYELVMKCRDHNHEVWAGSKKELVSLSLMYDNCSVHESIKNVVLSGVTGEDFNMVLDSPIAKGDNDAEKNKS